MRGGESRLELGEPVSDWCRTWRLSLRLGLFLRTESQPSISAVGIRLRTLGPSAWSSDVNLQGNESGRMESGGVGKGCAMKFHDACKLWPASHL